MAEADAIIAQARKVVDAVTFDDSGALVAGVWVGGNGGLLSRTTLIEVDKLRALLGMVDRPARSNAQR